VSGLINNFEEPYVPPTPPGPTPIPSNGVNPFFIIGITIGAIVLAIIAYHMYVVHRRKRLLENEEIADEKRLAEQKKSDLEKVLTVEEKTNNENEKK
jgi:Na+-transporting methylmalonyl-CoA/oxaloacetate decarboxylase gamma subunit